MEVPPQSDDLKWFGEGFDGFPKRLPDDTVEYIICVIDQKLNEAALRNRLKEIQIAATKLTREYLKDYIWQRDTFKLDLISVRDAPRPKDSAKIGKDIGDVPISLSRTLRGQTNFGDSIADEWLIVYLLRELSKQFPDAWIRVADNDGEFLLIEAAGVLDKWMNPEIAENRVWINKGQLRIIPKSGAGIKDIPQNVSLEAAISIISSSESSLIHSIKIEKEAFHRLREYPEAIAQSLHNAVIQIPRRLAYVLHDKAAYIAPAIESFAIRDHISTKPLNTKDIATLYFPPEDFVMVSVKFTKVGYAQIRAQEFPPPPSWTAIRPHAHKSEVSMGMKLACGFEMLLQDKQNQDKQTVREMKLLLDDVESGEDMLPTDAEMKPWRQTQDDEKWLDIDYEDLEKELSAKKGEPQNTGDFGDKATQENLRTMVSRFESFLDDDKAGIDGAEDREDMDFDDDDDDATSTGSSEPDSEGEDKDGSFDDKEFEQAMREMMGMPLDEVEKSGLLDDARKLALDMEDEEEGDRDEEEEVRQIMEMMEKELKGHGALKRGDGKLSKSQTVAPKKGKGKGKAAQKVEEEVDELSSDDENEDNDIDVELVKNMMEAFKGQAGMSGPASNMMAAMGINLPRDEGDQGEEE